jgi:methyl coenzyme M reductase subunit C
LILATANYGGSSTDYSTLLQFLKDGSVQAGPTRETSATEARYTFGVMRKINLDTSSHTFKIQYKTENTANTARINYAHIIAIRLDQFSNNYYTESESESAPVAPNTWYTKVTNTYTAQAADHIIIGSISYKAGSTSYSVGLKLVQGADVDQSPLVEHKDSTDYESCFMMGKASLSAGSVVDKIQYMGESTSARVKNARLISLQLPTQTVEVEFAGSSNTDSWTQLVWTVDSAWTTPSVPVTLQLYNYHLGQYPISGDGYMSYTSSATSNTDETRTQTITSNPTYFRNASGNWKVKVKGVKCTATQFNFKADLIKYETTTQVNTPPTLNPIGPKTVNELSTLSFTATATDPEAPPQTLTFSLGPGAPSGASITSGGAFSWTPTEAQGPGVYSINITVSDGIAIDYEVITVTVNEVNQPPVLNAIGNKIVNELTTLSFTATASDSDLPAQTLTFSLGPGAPSGASITSGGAFSWTPTESQGPGVYSINITVSDGTAIDFEVITVTVNEVNQPPVLNPIGSKAVNELSTLTFTATASDSDIPAQTLTFSLGPGAPSGASITSGGAFSWTPTEAQGPGVYSINVTVSDGVVIDYEIISVTVYEVNVAPVLNPIGSKAVNELSTLSFTATASDADIPLQTLTFSLGAGAPSGASITSGGAFSWTPTEAQGPGVYSINITVSDGVAIDYEVISVTVYEVNQPPVLDPIGNKNVNELTTLSFTATASDADIPAQTLTFALGPGAPSGASITSGGAFSWTPTEAQGPGVYSINITVSDGVAIDYEVISVTVYEVNVAPVLSPIGPKSINELSTLSFTAVASDSDIPAQTLTFSLGPGAPSGASITSGGAFSWTPTEAQGPGVYSINITVSDGTAIDYEIITVTVYEVNTPPVLDPIGPKSVAEENTLSFTATASDSDLPAQTLTFSLGPGAPSGASITSGGAFSWTPTEAQGPGVYSINITVSDGIAIDYEVISVTVTEVNQPPVLAPIGPKSINELSTLSFTATASDPDIPAQSLIFSLGSGAPSGASITSGGAFSWTPTEAQGPGVYTVRVIVSDGIAQDYEDITVTVNEVNQPPVLNPIGPKTIAVGSLLQFTVSASDPDLPVQTLTFSASNLPTGATFNPTTHVFSWTPTSGQDGVYPNVHFAVSDGTLSDTEDITITVTALAPAVSISPTAASILIGHSVSFTSTVSGGHGPFTYQWYVDDVLQPLATGSTFTFTPPTTGIYYVYVKVTDSNSNVAQSETARVVVGAVSVGGHSFSPSKPVANTALAYYVMLLAFFSAVICITRRKRK